MDEQQLQEQAVTIIEQSKELVIFGKEDNEMANGLLKVVMRTKKDISTFWKEPIEKAHQAHKALTAKKAEMLKPVNFAEQVIKMKISEYLTKERQERERQERELRLEAEKKEQERLVKIAEEEAKLREAEGFLSPEQMAEEKRKIEEKNKKEYIPEVKIEKEETPSGQIVKTLWRAEVTDKKLVPEEYKIVDQSALDKIAVALKEKANVPGVKFYSKISVTAR